MGGRVAVGRKSSGQKHLALIQCSPLATILQARKAVVGKIKGKPGQETYWADGVQVDKASFDSTFPDCPIEPGDVIGGIGARNWPMVSEALALHPRQVEEGNALNAKHGIATRYDPKTGCAIIPTPADRRKLLKREQAYDKHAFM